MSIKNLLRGGSRSLITIIAVCIGFASIVFLYSFGYGIEKLTTSKITSPENLSVFETNFTGEGKTIITEQDVSDLTAIDGVVAVAPATYLPASVALGSAKTDVIANISSVKYLSIREPTLIAGETYTEDNSRSVIISLGLQKLLNISETEISNLSIDVALEASADMTGDSKKKNKTFRSVRITGISDDSSPTILMAPDIVREDLNLINYNTARIKTDNKDVIPQVRRRVEELGFSTSYIGDTIEQINKFFALARNLISAFGILAMAVAILGMFNTLTVSLLERTQEIGVLKSLGSRSRDIFWLFITESLTIGFLGSIIGILLGMFTCYILNYIYNQYAVLNGSIAVNLFNTPLTLIITVLTFGVVVGALTGVYPAIRASRIKILDAIKYE